MVADVWFTYEATCTGQLTVSTCNIVNFDTDIVVYRGSCDDLDQIDCNGDSDNCEGFTSFLQTSVVAGEQYLIRIGGCPRVGSPVLDEIRHGGCRTFAKQPRELGSAVRAQYILGDTPAHTSRNAQEAEQRRTATGHRRIVDFSHRPSGAARFTRQPLRTPEWLVVDGNVLGVRCHPGSSAAPSAHQ